MDDDGLIARVRLAEAGAGRRARAGGLSWRNNSVADEPWARGTPLKQEPFPLLLDVATEHRPMELTPLGLPDCSVGVPPASLPATEMFAESGDAGGTPLRYEAEHASLRPPQALQIHDRYLVHSRPRRA